MEKDRARAQWSIFDPLSSILRPFSSDVGLLFVTRMVRMFAYGSVALILFLYLREAGLSPDRIGLLITMTLIGDTIVSLGITTTADRVGRKWMLILGAALMVLGSIVFALTDSFVPLLLAATVGVISPSGNEVGPFLPIEQAALAQTSAAEQRTHRFAWYHLAGSLATAAGSLACGWLVQSLQAREVSAVESFRVILFAYAGAGICLAVLFAFLSSKVEAEKRESKIEDGESKIEDRTFESSSSILNPRSSIFGFLTRRQGFLGLHRSRGVVLKLSGLFVLDAFAGGFILQSIIADWFHMQFEANPATLGSIFFGANLLAGLSAFAAARIAKHVGLIKTMVYTHVPSNILLILLPFMPTLPLAIAVLLLRFSISQMDVPARQSYTAAVVEPDERSAAAGITGVARSTGSALSPSLAGWLLGVPALAAAPFVLAGALKLVYDGLLYRQFSKVIPPEEVKE
jgi:MFS family permease